MRNNAKYCVRGTLHECGETHSGSMSRRRTAPDPALFDGLRDLSRGTPHDKSE